ncbi:hypothetical protein P3X46_020116 [Hevea brasiliensis]|uniref:NTF2-like domain-containing protein n=1 Tax=Hevea brasiliensis TaxID=3981 RepID=A0ABQ9LKW8_HEVBR|nr:uncharacterized protein LOC110658489 [Hevea brasiliensis]KAJ9168616.1 hypothetical protein P3X46_020116 [Hevea brasiliensis]
MAFLLPNLSPSLLLNSKSSSSREREKPINCQAQNQTLSTHFQSTTAISTTISSTKTKPSNTNTSLSPSPPQGAQVKTPLGYQDEQQHQRDDFYVNLGLAVRTLREDLPLLFTKDLNYDIYRDDITFLDPLNTFAGIEKYKLIFWALRFHGKMLFREISLEVYRIWQPSENVILIRWNLKGVPRVPWEAKGQFQGTSRYKLDRNGKIYEHKVDNLAFNFPQPLKPAASVLDLVAACPASPNPTFLFGNVEVYSSSWVEFYRAVRETLNQEGCQLLLQDGFVTCS